MVEIECLACGKTLKIPQFVNTDNYDGQVVCQECKSLLHLKLVKGALLKYKIVEKFEPAGKPSKLEIEIVRAHETEQRPREEGNIVKDTEDSS